MMRALEKIEATNVITRDSSQLDLRNQAAVRNFYDEFRPDYVFFAAAKVGGIYANQTYPAEFIYDNTMMAANSIDAAYRFDVSRFLFLGSTCIYPKNAPQPIHESSLLTSPLEPTNEAYALAKIAGLKMCEHFELNMVFSFIRPCQRICMAPATIIIRKTHMSCLRSFDAFMKQN